MNIFTDWEINKNISMTNCWIKLLKCVNIINYKRKEKQTINGKKQKQKRNSGENLNVGTELDTTL